jgi:hypothetical protein
VPDYKHRAFKQAFLTDRSGGGRMWDSACRQIQYNLEHLNLLCKQALCSICVCFAFSCFSRSLAFKSACNLLASLGAFFEEAS